MDNKKFRRQLEQLKNEIDNTQPSDERGKELLQRTREDIDHLLEQMDRKTTSHAETASRLEETIAYMEATHPKLTLMMTDLLDILSNAGI